MKQHKCEFDALIGAQGLGYRCGVWARTHRHIAWSAVDLGSIAVVALVAAGIALGFPALIVSTEQDLARLIHL